MDNSNIYVQAHLKKIRFKIDKNSFYKAREIDYFKTGDYTTEEIFNLSIGTLNKVFNLLYMESLKYIKRSDESEKYKILKLKCDILKDIINIKNK